MMLGISHNLFFKCLGGGGSSGGVMPTVHHISGVTPTRRGEIGGYSPEYTFMRQSHHNMGG